MSKYIFPSKRYFISDLESKVCQQLITILSEENTEQKHLVIGSTINPDPATKPHHYVDRVIPQQRIEFMSQLILDSDVIVYDLEHCDLQEVELAIKTLKMRELTEQKVLILISSVMVWQGSSKKVKVELPDGADEEDDDINEDALSEEGQLELEQQQEQQQQEQQEEDQQPKQYQKYIDKDYHQRKPTQSKYERIRSIETLCISASIDKPMLKSYVVCGGIQYGLGENVFYQYFRQSWLQSPAELRVFGDGNNRIPMIHTRDLACFVKKVEEVLPDQKYIFAVDYNKKNKYKRIVQTISKGMGTGAITFNENKEQKQDQQVDNENPSLLRNKQVECRDEYKLDLLVRPSRVFDKYMNDEEDGDGDDADDQEDDEDDKPKKKVAKYKFVFPWVSKEGLQSSFKTIHREFIGSNNLQPIKILVQGPPGCGKSYLSQKLSMFYNIPHLHLKEVIRQYLELESEFGEEIKNIYNEQKDKLIEIENERLEKVREWKEKNNMKIEAEDENVDESKLDVRLPEQLVNRIIIDRLNHNECINRGYVLDGYPKHYKQVQTIFMEKKQTEDGDDADVDEDNDNEEDENVDQTEVQKEPKNKIVNQQIIPDAVIVLDCEHNVVKERLMRLPESSIKGTHWNEEGLNRRNQIYQKFTTNMKNKGLKVMEDFFIERKRDVMNYQIKQSEIRSKHQINEEKDLFESVRSYVERNGVFKNYQEFEQQREQERQQKTKERIERMEKQYQKYEELKNTQEEEQRALVNEEYKWKIKDVAQQDRQLLEEMSGPLKQYLEKNVIPFLVEGLNEIVKNGPQDGLDYLAEFLFKKSLEVDKKTF